MNVARAWGLRLMRLCEPRAAAGTRDRVSPVTARAVMQEPQGSGSLNEGRFYEAGRPVPIRKQIAERIGDSALRCGNNDVDPVARGCRPTDRTVSTGPSRPNAGGAKNV